MRSVHAILLASGLVALSAAPAASTEVKMGKHTSSEIKNACDKAGGTYTEDPGGYGCATNCHGGPGGACVVGCKSNHQCTGEVPLRTTPASVLRPPAGALAISSKA